MNKFLTTYSETVFYVFGKYYFKNSNKTNENFLCQKEKAKARSKEKHAVSFIDCN